MADNKTAYCKKRIDNLKIIKVNSSTYIGVLSEDIKLIEYAMSITLEFTATLSKDTFCKWFEKFNLGYLQDITLGTQTSCQSRELTIEEKQNLEFSWEHFQRAIQYSHEYMEVELFKKLVYDRRKEENYEKK